METGEIVAIKKIAIRSSNKPGIPDNVLREIKALQVLEHPNIVRLLDVFPKVSTAPVPSRTFLNLPA